jgi:hypothetical protein
MPLELLSFEVFQVGDDINIHWKAVHDPTVARIFLEHSVDQQTWDCLTEWIPSGPDLDNGRYTHSRVSSGIHYYRLITQYRDGELENSGIRFIRLGFESNLVHIWPNPATDRIEVFVQSMQPQPVLQYFLVDMHGRINLSIQSTYHVVFDLSQLERGVYFLHIPVLCIVQRVVKS